MEMTTLFVVTSCSLTQFFSFDKQVVVGCAVSLSEASSNTIENHVVCCSTLIALESVHEASPSNRASRPHIIPSASCSPLGSKKAFTKLSTAWNILAVSEKPFSNKNKKRWYGYPPLPFRMFTSEHHVSSEPRGSGEGALTLTTSKCYLGQDVATRLRGHILLDRSSARGVAARRSWLSRHKRSSRASLGIMAQMMVDTHAPSTCQFSFPFSPSRFLWPPSSEEIHSVPDRPSQSFLDGTVPTRVP